MGSYKRPHAFRPIDLEVIDRVYEVAWETIKAQDLFRDTNADEERKQRLRRMLFVLAKPGNVDFDQLCDQVLTNVVEPWSVPPRKRRSPPACRPGGGRVVWKQEVKQARQAPQLAGLWVGAAAASSRAHRS